MPARSSGPTVVRRRLGSALRLLREQANIRLEAAARELECSAAKISRMENGLGPARAIEVRALLDLYGLEDPESRRRIEDWATRTKSTGWWESDADLVDDDDDRFIATETESVQLRMYCTPVFPPILQTPEYALAHLRGQRPDLTYEDTQRLVKLRMARRDALLDRSNELRLDAVIDESAIRRHVGSSEILSSQLHWLSMILHQLKTEKRDDITLQVLPFTAGAPGRAASAFTLFTPREHRLDPIVSFVEDTCGGSWHEHEDSVEDLSKLFDELRSRALDPEESQRILRETLPQ